ncbi:ribosome silencing factor [Leptolyngbya sp. FACHB-36]|uniref:ribosome silencing factor n=1 Tax=Leptolyngbya sp. FACHB-36 TaxID=2692808 RepID=UPI001681793E|nr:ribosome silencing factor [Leptolyngbya sp. FACHB-36]MBD2021164.1 ribosome silencing factor [Leptolyngbya sp. FACHB-36]
MPNQNVHTLFPIAANVTNQSVAPDDTLELVRTIVQAADERKGADMALLHVTEVSTLADYFLIVTGFSKVQVRAIARSIEDQVEETFQRRPIHTEGQTDGTWILQDYGDVIVHIQLPEEREFYNLEAFWGHAKRLETAEFVQA